MVAHEHAYVLLQSNRQIDRITLTDTLVLLQSYFVLLGIDWIGCCTVVTTEHI